MFNEQEQALIGAIKADVNQIFDERSKGLISQDAYKSGIEDVTKRLGDTAETLKVIQETIAKNEEALKVQGLTLADIATRASKEDKNDLELTISKHIDALKDIASRKEGTLTVKTDYTRASVTSNPMGIMIPDYGQIGNAKFGLYDLFPKIQVDAAESNGVIRYIDQTTATRNAAATAEKTAYPEAAAAWQGYSLPLESIGNILPVTEETFRHTKRLAQELEMFLQTNVRHAIETELATGDGTTPNLNGVYTAATAYTASAGSVTDASIYDLIVKMAEDITGNTTYGGKYQPDFAILNVSDINKMRLKKDANYNYVVPPFATRDGSVISGMRIIESPYITADTCVVGDSRFVRIYEDGGYELAFGYNTSLDFGKRLLSMRAHKYMAQLIRAVDATGLRKSSGIAADLLTLNTIP